MSNCSNKTRAVYWKAILYFSNETQDTPSQLAKTVKYADCNAAAGEEPLATSVLDIKLNQLYSWDFGGLRSTSSCPLLPSPFLLGVVAPLRVISKGQVELFNHLTVCKQMTAL